MVRVLHVHGAMEKGGTESVIMNIYRNIDRNDINFEFTKFNREESAYDKEIETLGGKFHYIKSRQEYGNFQHIKSLYRLFRQCNFDVIHTHMNFHGGIVAAIAKICGIKNVICHAHSSSEDKITFKRLIEISILKLLIALFSNYQIACSDSAGQFCFLKFKKYILLTNAVDLNKYYPIDIEDDNIIRIVHIGRFVPVKNHKGIIELAQKLKEKQVNFEISLVGDGELFEEINQLVKKHDLSKEIKLLGARDNINEILNSNDICILPSLYEGLPLALVEAQATGIPCIVSKNITLEADMGLGNFYFADIKQLDAWVELILNLKNKKIKDKSFIEECFIKRGYSLNENISKITNIYKSRI